jgi:hypothetical protein
MQPARKFTRHSNTTASAPTHVRASAPAARAARYSTASTTAARRRGLHVARSCRGIYPRRAQCAGSGRLNSAVNKPSDSGIAPKVVQTDNLDLRDLMNHVGVDRLQFHTRTEPKTHSVSFPPIQNV